MGAINFPGSCTAAEFPWERELARTMGEVSAGLAQALR